MTTINFPASPIQGQIYTFQDRSWIWNGRAWQTKSTFVGYTGSQGAAGADGASGFTGSRGLSGEAAAIGFTGSAGAGFTGSQGVVGDPGGTTLTVTSPYGGIYIVDGANNPVLNFIRGNRYVININATNHPFYLQTSGLTYNAGLTYTNGVTGNGTQVGTIIFQVPYNAPDTLTYVCGYHANMGNTINISNLGPTGFTGSSGASTLDGLTDVDVASAVQGQVLGYTGSNWAPTTVTASVEAVLERHYRKTGTLTVSLGSEKWYIPVDSTIIGIIARVETAPTGTSSGIEISVNVTNTAGNKTAVATLNINNSYNASDVFSTPLTVLFNEFVTVDIISVGTSTAGADLTVTFTYTRN